MQVRRAAVHRSPGPLGPDPPSRLRLEERLGRRRRGPRHAPAGQREDQADPPLGGPVADRSRARSGPAAPGRRSAARPRRPGPAWPARTRCPPHGPATTMSWRHPPRSAPWSAILARRWGQIPMVPWESGTPHDGRIMGGGRTSWALRSGGQSPGPSLVSMPAEPAHLATDGWSSRLILRRMGGRAGSCCAGWVVEPAHVATGRWSSRLMLRRVGGAGSGGLVESGVGRCEHGGGGGGRGGGGGGGGASGAGGPVNGAASGGVDGEA